MAADLCTQAQVKTRGNIGDTGQDALITSLIADVLPRLNSACNREFMPQADATRTFEVKRHLVRLPGCDLRSATTVTLHPESEDEATVLTEGTDYVIELDRLTSSAGAIRLSEALALTSTFSANFGYAKIEIAGAWGIWNDTTEVPADLNAAAIECILSWLDKPIASATSVEQWGAWTQTPGGAPSWDIPTSAYRKLAPYTRHWGVK